MLALESKIDKLSEKIDEILAPETNVPKPKITNLIMREQEVFLLIYAAQKPIKLNTIATKLGFSQDTVKKHVNNLIQKGIPLLKEATNKSIFLSLDLKFKDLQAKKGLVKVDRIVSKHLTDEGTL